MMTTTVTIKTRGRGASGSCAGESFKMGPNEERKFHTDDTLSLSLNQQTEEEAKAAMAEVEAAAVPGSTQNDALIRDVDPAKLGQLSGNTTRPQGNMTGATEVAAATDEAGDLKARR